MVLGDPRLPDPVKRDGRYNEEDIETIDAAQGGARTNCPAIVSAFSTTTPRCLPICAANRPHFVLNFCDEGFNNDAFMEMHVPALLEMLDIPYSGAGPACLGLCYNKSLVRGIAQSIDVPVPAETYFNSDDLAATIPSVFPGADQAQFRRFLDRHQQGRGGAQLGGGDRLSRPAARADAGLCPILIQEFLTGPEYIDRHRRQSGLGLPRAAAARGRLFAARPGLPRLLPYESKWVPESPYWSQIGYREARLDEEARRKIVDYSNILFERLGCRDYARFDFRADAEGEIKLLEVNPNPGWCWDGKLNLMAEMAGLRYCDLLRLIIEAAQERVAAQRPGLVIPIAEGRTARAGRRA